MTSELSFNFTVSVTLNSFSLFRFSSSIFSLLQVFTGKKQGISLLKIECYTQDLLKSIPHCQDHNCTECKRVRERKKERTLSNITMSVFARKLSVCLSPSYAASPTLSAHKSTNLYTVYTAEKPCATQSDMEHRLVPNRKRSMSRLYIVTLLI